MWSHGLKSRSTRQINTWKIVKALHGKAAAALRAAQEAWQRLEELQDCVSECFLVFSSFSDLFSVGDKALCQYLIRAGLATGLQGDQHRLYVSTQTRETGGDWHSGRGARICSGYVNKLAVYCW